MKITTKIIHNIIKSFGLEEVVIQKKLLKFIPLHRNYSSKSYRQVTRANATFNLDISDYMQWHIWANLNDLSWKKGAQQGEGEILDIGANVGAFSLKTLQNNTNKITLHSFEPNPLVFEKLQNNFSLNPNLNGQYKLNKIGIAEQKGQLDFFWNEQNSGGGSFSHNEQNAIKEVIDVTTIDEYVSKHQLSKIQLIKIDVEGYEPQVLKGATETIKTQKPTIFIEVSPEWWRKNNYNPIDVLSIFEMLDYQFFIVIDEKELKETLLEDLKNINHQFNLYLTSK